MSDAGTMADIAGTGLAVYIAAEVCRIACLVFRAETLNHLHIQHDYVQCHISGLSHA